MKNLEIHFASLTLLLLSCACSGESGDSRPSGPGATSEARPATGPATIGGIGAKSVGGVDRSITAAGAKDRVPDTDPAARLAIVGPDSHDFGEVDQGMPLEHRFELASAGSSPVRLLKVSPTCGCTVPEVEVGDGLGSFGPYVMGDAILPGRPIRLTARVDTTGKTGRLALGVQVLANDPQGLIQLGLAAHARPFLSISPPTVDFGSFFARESQSATFDIETRNGEPIALAPAGAMRLPAGIELNLEPVDSEGGQPSAHWRAHVRTGQSLTGLFTIPVTLDTGIPIEGAEPLPGGAPRTHVARFGIRGVARAPLTASVSNLTFGVVQPGQVVGRTVRIDVSDPALDLDALTVHAQGAEDGEGLPWPDVFHLTTRPVSGRRSVDVQLTLDGLPAGAEGPFRGRLIVVGPSGGAPAGPGAPDGPESPLGPPGPVPAPGAPDSSAPPRIEIPFSGVARAGTGR